MTVVDRLQNYVAKLTGVPRARDEDLFAAGGLSSLMALELVVHLEKEFGVAVGGEDLRLDNFRTVDAMAGLVRKLGGA